MTLLFYSPFLPLAPWNNGAYKVPLPAGHLFQFTILLLPHHSKHFFLQWPHCLYVNEKPSLLQAPLTLWRKREVSSCLASRWTSSQVSKHSHGFWKKFVCLFWDASCWVLVLRSSDIKMNRIQPLALRNLPPRGGDSKDTRGGIWYDRGKEAHVWECTGGTPNPAWGIREGFWKALKEVTFKMNHK